MTDTLQGFLDSGASFEGKICFSGVVRIDGHLHGDVSGDGTLVVGETGLVEATIQVASLIVLGAVIGEITAEDRVELGAGGQIEGSVETSRLKVDEGARLSAKITMRKPALGSPQRGG